MICFCFKVTISSRAMHMGLVTKLCPTVCNSMYCSPPALFPWDFPCKNTGVGCHFLLQRIFLIQGLNPRFPHCRWILYCWAPGEALIEQLRAKHNGSVGKALVNAFRASASDRAWLILSMMRWGHWKHQQCPKTTSPLWMLAVLFKMSTIIPAVLLLDFGW